MAEQEGIQLTPGGEKNSAILLTLKITLLPMQFENVAVVKVKLISYDRIIKISKLVN
ncbi:MAG TPA: hypothetical protein V6D28_01315 [Leptolyngbyaceae cyanobacterium]|nr:hypothetical protein [Nostocaceae cyanobacterium]